MGLSILGTFGTMVGLGVARQAVEGGADLGEEARSTAGLLMAWLRVGGPLLLLAAAAAWTERRLSRHWAAA